ncbi:MAG: ssl1498 family light-harvesting-like protein [Leptolyngbyaceae cyanobacterium RU_5_1]|nr:ssl1498 family light-harvesting-like protein [Leptolyngbyaceae cyanobacterium RU_5_1]
MSYTKTQGRTLNLNEKHRSDGSELIPAEVQANIRQDDIPSLDAPLAIGYTVDEEGLINNYAIQPDMSTSEYPSPEQQRRYVFLGAGATLLVVMLLLVTFSVS